MNKNSSQIDSKQLQAFARRLSVGAQFNRSEKFKRTQLRKLQAGLGMAPVPFWRRSWATAGAVSFASVFLAGFALTFGTSHPSPTKPVANQKDDARAEDALQQALTPAPLPSAAAVAQPQTQAPGAPIEIPKNIENNKAEAPSKQRAPEYFNSKSKNDDSSNRSGSSREGSNRNND